jgi:hypothetical protein
MDEGNFSNDHLKRCVIIAAPGAESAALAQALGDRGVDCHVADDVTPGGAISREIIRQLAAADFVAASLQGAPSLNVAFELGIAHALRKPVIAFTTNYDRLFDGLAGTYVVRRAPGSGLEFTDDIDRFLRHATLPPAIDQPLVRSAADLTWARERAAKLKVAHGAEAGRSLEQLVVDLFEAAGDPIIHGKEQPDRGVDLIAWENDAGAPVIIECKHYAGSAGSVIANVRSTVETLQRMVANSDAQMALLVLSSNHPRQPAYLPEAPQVSVVRIETLIDALESGHPMSEIMRRRQRAAPPQGMVGAAD